MSIEYRNEVMIDRRSTKPIHEQIYSQLENLLSSARVINNEAVIKASDLAKKLNVSLEEVEKAYYLLEKNKFIKFDESKVPYVIKYARILDFFSKLIFIEDGIKSLGKEPSVENIEFDIVKVDNSEVIPIHKYKDDRFLRQTRLFKADDEPYFYLEEFYPIERFPKLMTLDKDFCGTIYVNVLQKEYDIDFVRNKRKVNVHLFGPKLSKILQVKQGLTGFKIDLTYYDQNNIAFAYGHAYSLPHFYFEYDVHL
ncbi:MAG: GntR family transcriptional regulator [Tenericutes bacterium]|jgi:DNA-binding GntR family transcriptional regulator|nr:GntR family transcriptional regulator [Mycoplasmatota bacterium]